MICITLISIHLQLGLLYKCSKCSIKNWLGGGGGSATVKLTTDLLQYLCLWGRLLAVCDNKKSASLKERDAEEVPLRTSAMKEKPLDEKPQAAVVDGGDKSTLLTVTYLYILDREGASELHQDGNSFMSHQLCQRCKYTA